MNKSWHSNEYSTHIDSNSPEWEDLRRRRNLVDDNRCAVCGTPVFATKRKALALHHMYYSEDLLDINTVISVCDRCHGILEGRIIPGTNDFDPRSRKDRERLKDYVRWTQKLITGEVTRDESLTPGNCGPKAYLQYQKNAGQQSTED